MTIQQGSPNAITAGQAVGDAAAEEILKLREFDGVKLPESSSAIFRSREAMPDPLKWRQDPFNASPGANWRYTRQFVLEKPDVFRPGLPPDVGSPDNRSDYNDALLVGGDAVARDANPLGQADRRRTPSKGDDCEQGIHL